MIQDSKAGKTTEISTHFKDNTLDDMNRDAMDSKIIREKAIKHNTKIFNKGFHGKLPVIRLCRKLHLGSVEAAVLVPDEGAVCPDCNHVNVVPEKFRRLIASVIILHGFARL